MSYCVALTGTIASGKSTAAKHFQHLGIDIINADNIARKLVQPGQPAWFEIQTHFGSDILTPQGELNRRKLRQYIIHRPQDKIWLEACLHPKIREEIEKQMICSTSPYTLIEIPLLKSRQDYPYIDRVLLISSTAEQQISRITKRDHCTTEEAMALLHLQKEQAEKHLTIADDRIENNGSLSVFIAEIEKLHHFYLRAAKNK